MMPRGRNHPPFQLSEQNDTVENNLRMRTVKIPTWERATTDVKVNRAIYGKVAMARKLSRDSFITKLSAVH